MSGGQHVGRLSDSLSDTEDREQQHASLKKLMQPPKRAHVKVDVANGDPCPVEPRHGKMFVLSPSGKQWCPHSDHTAKRKEFTTDEPSAE